jgi:uncharacterized membrane protein YdbT with pleckstrin-like domain
MAAAPLFFGVVSLASVSPWVGSDGVLVVAPLLVGCVLVAWCFKALLRPFQGGWFKVVSHGAAQELNVGHSLKRVADRDFP